MGRITVIYSKKINKYLGKPCKSFSKLYFKFNSFTKGSSNSFWLSPISKAIIPGEFKLSKFFAEDIRIQLNLKRQK